MNADASNEAKRSRGRPAKVDALTPAERAKRYREKNKALSAANPVTDKAPGEMQAQLVKLQLKYDLEHMAVMNLQTELANLRQAAVTKKPAANPLAKQVARLQATVAEQDKIISAYSAELNKLRDDLAASRKD